MFWGNGGKWNNHMIRDSKVYEINSNPLWMAMTIVSQDLMVNAIKTYLN